MLHYYIFYSYVGKNHFRRKSLLDLKSHISDSGYVEYNQSLLDMEDFDTDMPALSA